MSKREAKGNAVIPRSNATTGEAKRILQDVFPPTVKVEDVNRALSDLRHSLYQAMGIVRMTSNASMESNYEKVETDVWTSLDAAHEILCHIADRIQTANALLGKDVHRGDY